ncbi:sensor domain-containing protein [Paludibacterium paludis]|uniref:GGDEF domain-containing protein n=1 Tax=Paludibacterium paludis TaxID=1225769 RepID=A0A918P187_9NEIS|nr:EAL domain-containing protein [Paludibacterium paludis]GGY12025.1 GGDEF domain-containing protein [Paludibacterium paludis]
MDTEKASGFALPHEEALGAVWLVGRDRRIEFANAAACRLSGLPPDAMTGRPVDQRFFSTPDAPPLPLAQGPGLRFSREPLPDGRLLIQAAHPLHETWRQSEARFRLMFECSPVGSFHFDATGRITACNDRFVALMGSSRDALEGLDMLSLPDNRITNAVRTALAGDSGVYEGRYHSVTGRRDLDVRALFAPLTDHRGEVTGGLGLVEDFSERKHAEEALLAYRQRLALLVEQTALAVIEWDERFCVRDWNPAASQMFGYSREEAIGQHAYFILDETERQRVNDQVLQSLLSQRGGHRFTNNNLTRAGRTIICEWFNTTLVDSDGRTLGVISLVLDITERRLAEQQIRYLAHYDPLTGLPNRALLTDRAVQALNAAQSEDRPLALMFLDIDHFKNVNDTLGHSIGDALLAKLARRFGTALRRTDTVSRLGGDEFIFLLPDCDADGAAHVAQQLLAETARDCRIGLHEFSVSASIGIALYPVDGTDFETLSRAADIAMYRAKQEGRNTFRLFEPKMQERAARHLAIENALRRALERNELTLHYQPQQCLKSGRILGVEALLRWKSAELGDVPPAEFIPLAEESGLIVPIGEWVMRTAARQMVAWMAAGLPPLVVAVNLSMVQFRQSNLPARVGAILADTGLPAGLLEIELTESVSMNQPEAAIAMTRALQACGVMLSVDDFGTCYSSLAYLKRLSIDKLKIDRSFIGELDTDHDDQAIVSAIVSLAGSLGLQTVAEGVESPGQLDFLSRLGCDIAQGYLISRPLAAPDMFRWLKSRAGSVRAAPLTAATAGAEPSSV